MESHSLDVFFYLIYLVLLHSKKDHKVLSFVWYPGRSCSFTQMMCPFHHWKSEYLVLWHNVFNFYLYWNLNIIKIAFLRQDRSWSLNQNKFNLSAIRTCDFLIAVIFSWFFYNKRHKILDKLDNLQVCPSYLPLTH